MTSILVAIVVLLVLSAASSGTETAIFSLDTVRLRTLAEKKVPGALLLEKMRATPQRVLGTLLLFNNAVNVGIASITTLLVADLTDDLWLGFSTAIITIIIVIFGEYAPKTYAAHHAERYALIASYPVWVLTLVLSPFVFVIERVVKAVFGEPAPIAPRIGEEDIRTMARMGARAGTVEAGEREMIERVFLFNDITAHDVMTPREDIEWLRADAPITDILPELNRTKFSRFPVRDADGKVTGIVHIKDVLEAFAESAKTGSAMPTAAEISKPAMFVAETKLIDDLFRDFQRNHAHMAVVINEYGSPVGLVTVDDLLAELVGEISDETDIDEHVIKRIDKTTIVVHGDAEISDINRFFNAKLIGPSNKTVSRVIMETVGDVPREGAVVELTDAIVATVEAVGNLRIQRVRLAKKMESPKLAK